MIAVIYTPMGKRLISGRDEDIIANLTDFEKEPGAQIRRLDGTGLDDIGTTLDERLPSTADAFDLTFPNALDWK